MQLVATALYFKIGSNSMCETNAFLMRQGAETELMKDVMGLVVQEDQLILTDLLGEEKKVRASIKSIDFANHKLILEEK